MNITVRRFRLAYFAVLMFPLVGVIIALVLLAFLGSKPLTLLLVAASMIPYLTFVIYIWRKFLR